MTHELRFWARRRRCRFTSRANVMVVFMITPAVFPIHACFAAAREESLSVIGAAGNGPLGIFVPIEGGCGRHDVATVDIVHAGLFAARKKRIEGSRVRAAGSPALYAL